MVGRQNDIRTIYISLNKFSCNGWNENIGRLFPTTKSDSSMHRINEKYIIIWQENLKEITWETQS